MKHGFNPETVIWTDRMTENVLAEAGVYENLALIDPNADKNTYVKDKNGNLIQKPYMDEGTGFSGWSYSEYLWTRFYPIGCGRLAAMAAGGIDRDVIQINEDTCWDGSPYADMINENGERITTREQTFAARRITAENPTGGSVKGGWKYLRGADSKGAPAPIGAADVLVGDEEFREKYPGFANKSISNMSLNINNARERSAVRERYGLHRLVETKFLGKPKKQRAYKSFVEVYLDFGHSYKDAENYVKSLDLETGIVTVEYDHGGHHFKREYFASYPDQAIVIRAGSDSEFDMTAELHTYHNDKKYLKYEKISDREIRLVSAVTDGGRDGHLAETNAIRFEAAMILGGDGRFEVSGDQKSVKVSGCTNAEIYIVGATNYVNRLELDNSKPERDCGIYSTNIKKRTYEQIKARHIQDFTERFSRSSLTIDNKEGFGRAEIPTEKRVRKDINGMSGYLTGSGSDLAAADSAGVETTYTDGDYKLAALEFNFGKYLILSGSRPGMEADGDNIAVPGSQPLNLTGKWNAAMTAGWNGKYTININTEMNYWAAQPLNLAECERPFIDTFKELARSGSITADYQYGIGDSSAYKPGDPWVMHHNFDLWRGTQPIDNATAGLWPTGGAWLMEHAWQYYKFSGDEKYLADVYPYMVGAAKFFTEYPVLDPKTGYLVTAASCSPEQGGVQPGAAMDTQLVRNLYDMVRRVSKILGKEKENADLLSRINEQMPSSYFADEKGKLAPDLIDESGLIKEWARGDVLFDLKDSGDPNLGGYNNIKDPFSGREVGIEEHKARAEHRHCSHLWELYPGTHLDPYSADADEKKLFDAFCRSVAAKDNADGKGWSLAWRMNLNARALRGGKAERMLIQLLRCRTAPNLFDQHPDFQIDGNLGAAAGIAEMLLQSHGGTVDILPALPENWQSGRFGGFRTRENAEVSAAWKDGRVTEVSLKAQRGGAIKMHADFSEPPEVFGSSGAAAKFDFDPKTGVVSINAEEGEIYIIKAG